MRRLGGVFDTVASTDNLWQAWCDYRKGKRSRRSVRAFDAEAGRQVVRLSRELGDGSYRPGGYRLLGIHEPKRRLIAAAPVRDRVVHRAIHRVVAPALDRGLIDATYACLPGRGSHRALLAMLAALRRYRYVLLLDVRAYFPSVRHAALRQVLRGELKDRRLLALTDVIIDSGDGLYRADGVAEFLGLEPGFPPPGCGLPIGNLTSQAWGNLYLSGLDHYVKRELKVPHYQRYLDDLALAGDSRSELAAARDALAAWLWRERGQVLKRPDARPRSTRARHRYLGYRVSRAGVEVPAAVMQRMRVRMGELVLRGDPEAIERMAASYRGVVSFLA